jgi:hypothetical protein
MTNTPRTDAEFTDDYYVSGYVPTEFAQQLERELAETKRLLMEAKGRLAHVKGCSVLDFKGDCSCGLAEFRIRIDSAIKESK